MKKILQMFISFVLVASLLLASCGTKKKMCPGMKGYKKDIKRGLAH